MFSMDKHFVRTQMEKILARQTGLSEKAKRLVKERLENLDWEQFTASVLEDYYQRVGACGDNVSPDECNQLLMDAIQERIKQVFSSP